MKISFKLSNSYSKTRFVHQINCILGSKDIIHYDERLSRPYNLTYVDLTSNSVKLLFFFNETHLDPRRQIQKLEVC